ncbi:MAG: SPOR domain-containing protein, partial [Gammaproteobacteria bacterium]|nr:SPOR domain-containing protein [Gammaproteobacteria bacterium]
VAHIQSVTVNSTPWHRVRIGPYSQSNDLYDKIDQLQQNGIKAMPMELKTNKLLGYYFLNLLL